VAALSRVVEQPGGEVLRHLVELGAMLRGLRWVDLEDQDVERTYLVHVYGCHVARESAALLRA